jgi:hypothetical protein
MNLPRLTNTVAGSRCSRPCRHDTTRVADNRRLRPRRQVGSSLSIEEPWRWFQFEKTHPDSALERRAQRAPSLPCRMPTSLSELFVWAESPQPSPNSTAPGQASERRLRGVCRGGAGRPCDSTLPSVRGELHAIALSAASGSLLSLPARRLTFAACRWLRAGRSKFHPRLPGPGCPGSSS